MGAVRCGFQTIASELTAGTEGLSAAMAESEQQDRDVQ
jgi:hypothetical protein